MISELDLIFNKILNKEQFCIIRPSDGEYLVLKKCTFSNIDNWKNTEDNTISDDLFESIKLAVTIPNMLIGIPCKDCGDNGEIYNYYIKTFNIPENKKTYANIFGTYNYKSVIHFLKFNKIPFYYVGPGEKETNELNIIDRYNIDEFLLNKWNTEKNNIKEKIEKWIENKNEIILFSCGPIAKILIPFLSLKYQNKTLIDIGSPLDNYLKGKKSRPYMIDNSREGNQICDFNFGHIYKYNNKLI